MKLSIGIDMGGTVVKAAAFSEDGEMLLQRNAPTADGKKKKGQHAWAVHVRELIRDMEGDLTQKADAIGMACPGLPSRDRRSIACLSNRLPGLEHFDWTEWLERPMAIPVVNDAQAALLGEVWQGAAKGVQNAVMLTLGTGVGGAILVDGRLLRGHIGRAGHLGHVSVDLHGEASIFGMPGALECHIGNYNVHQRTGGRYFSTKDLVIAVGQGNAEAMACWHRSVKALAVTIASLVNIVDPEVVILGGGIAQAGSLLWEPLDQHLSETEWRPLGGRVPIIPAALGEWAGTYGAAFDAMREMP